MIYQTSQKYQAFARNNFKLGIEIDKKELENLAIILRFSTLDESQCFSLRRDLPTVLLFRVGVWANTTGDSDC